MSEIRKYILTSYYYSKFSKKYILLFFINVHRLDYSVYSAQVFDGAASARYRTLQAALEWQDSGAGAEAARRLAGDFSAVKTLEVRETAWIIWQTLETSVR